MRLKGSKQFYLYRHFDKDGILLYVGISVSAIGRTVQHRTGSFWFDSVDHIKITRFASRQESLDAEQIVIKTEKPIHNIIHNPASSSRLSEQRLRELIMGVTPGEKEEHKLCREEREKAGLLCERESCVGCHFTTI